MGCLFGRHPGAVRRRDPGRKMWGVGLRGQGKRGVGKQVQLARLGAGQQQGPHHLGVEPPEACGSVRVVDKVLGPLKDHPHLLQVLQPKFSEAPARNDKLGRLDADSRNPENHLVVGMLDIYREQLRMAERPPDFRIQFQVQVRMILKIKIKELVILSL